MGKAVTRKSAGRDMATSSVSRRDRHQRWSHGAKRTSHVPSTSHNPPGLVGIHRLANRALLVSLLISSILCVLELQVRLNTSHTYKALQDARTMQQLFMDSRAQLMAALGTLDASGPMEQGDLSTNQDPEPLLLPPPSNRQVKRLELFENPGRWLNAGPILRGY